MSKKRPPPGVYRVQPCEYISLLDEQPRTGGRMPEALNTDCPCPEDCPLHGKCRECRRFHVIRGELTFCQQVDSGMTTVPERSLPTGREINLMDYAACAG
jgi:hypothetical protein